MRPVWMGKRSPRKPSGRPPVGSILNPWSPPAHQAPGRTETPPRTKRTQPRVKGPASWRPILIATGLPPQRAERSKARAAPRKSRARWGLVTGLKSRRPSPSKVSRRASLSRGTILFGKVRAEVWGKSLIFLERGPGTRNAPKPHEEGAAMPQVEQQVSWPEIEKPAVRGVRTRAERMGMFALGPRRGRLWL